MIRKILLSTVAIAAVSTAAFAADLPSRRAPPVYAPPPVPLFSWTGFYVGGDVGYAFGRDRVANTGFGPATGFETGQPGGTTGGMHIGYNFSTQSLPVLGPIAGGFSGLPFVGGFGGAGGVVGLEGDVQGTDYRSTQAFADPTGGPLGSTFTHRNEINGSARARVGIAVDRALFFATGGAAFAQFNNTYASPFFAGYQSISKSRVGWTVGGGIEYAITTQFSLRGEYRYTDYGHYTDAPAFAAGVVPSTFTHHDTVQRVTIGFSYKFDTPAAAPVVARY